MSTLSPSPVSVPNLSAGAVSGLQTTMLRAPQTLASLQGWSPPVTGSPATAWTVGQSVALGDASLAHWSSSAWVAGAA